MRINSVKQALKEGKLQIGCSFSQLRSPEAVKVLAAAGIQWSFIDGEHGGFNLETLQDLCGTAVRVGLCPIVRVGELQYTLVARALDCGAQGVLFPRVESPELLARAVSWTRFPPVGVRGYGLTAPHVEYEKASVAQIIEHLNQHTMVALQIETKLAVERREELLSVPGIDAVMIGPADLSISLGVAGEFDHPKLVEAMEQVRDSCIKHGIAPGTHTRTLAMAKFWKERGMRFLSCSGEIAFMLDKASETVLALRA
jgi:2-keto-3-deoxy-L-rhamnonate aldolase RhmA